MDAVAALTAAVFTLVMLHEGGLGAAEPGFHPLDAMGVVLTLASTLPLLFLRHGPIAVYALTAFASLLLLGLDYGLDVPPGPLIATYAIAETVISEEAPQRRTLAAAGVAAFLPIAVALMVLDGNSFLAMSSGVIAWVAMFGLVWTAGDRSRLRRERISELVVTGRLREMQHQSQQHVAVAQERTRISRELHDSAGHAINVILVQAGAARLLHERDPERSRAAIETIEEVARATIVDIDRLVHALRERAPLAGPAPASTADLEELVDQHRAGGLRVSTAFEGAPRGLPSGVAWAAYRILQEGLTNAARHGSGLADVRMAYGRSAVEIVVRNPVGKESRPGSGLGIVGMRERVAMLDGTLEAKDEGTGVFRLRARLPYDPPMPAGLLA